MHGKPMAVSKLDLAAALPQQQAEAAANDEVVLQHQMGFGLLHLQVNNCMSMFSYDLDRQRF